MEEGVIVFNNENMHNEKECCKQKTFEALKRRICKTF